MLSFNWLVNGFSRDGLGALVDDGALGFVVRFAVAALPVAEGLVGDAEVGLEHLDPDHVAEGGILAVREVLDEFLERGHF